MTLFLPYRRPLLGGPFCRNELWRRAKAVPSLDLRFAENKSLVDATTGLNLVTFSRTSDATFVNSNGVIQTASAGTPRFDHNPVTGESLGLLVEEQRTNLLSHSQEMHAAPWGLAAATAVANDGAAPDGTATADKIMSTGGGNFRSNVSVANATVYTYSVFLKHVAGTGVASQVGFERFGSTPLPASVSVNLIAGTITNNGAPVTASSITRYPNNWFRVSITATSTDVTTTVVNYTSASGNEFLVWGAQLEAGAFPTSYIPTGASAVTRAASLGDLISSAIANNIRSFYVEFRSPAVGTRGVVSLNDNTANERASVITSGTDPRLVVHDGGVEQANINGGTVSAGVRTRIAVRLNENDFAISINGGAVVTDTSGTLPTVDRLMLGRTQAGEYLNGTIARFTGWAQPLPSATLQAITG